jgi:hypothetical protein
VCEEPLRTVELIKRPLELRDPATKLLYLATLGLYPTSGKHVQDDIFIWHGESMGKAWLLSLCG